MFNFTFESTDFYGSDFSNEISECKRLKQN
jgi:hypothetical protein